MPPLDLRFATSDDADTLAGHRVAMFREMGFIDPAHEPLLHDSSAAYFRTAIPSGEYIGWIGSPHGEHLPVAGAGLQFRSLLPRPTRTHDGVLLGREGLVLNVYTDHAWRRRGVAHYLMDTIIQWAKHNGIVHLVLGASDEGRPLYEKMGFVPTREMRYTGALASWGPWTGEG